MDVPDRLPVVYASQIVLPGFVLKIHQQVKGNAKLLEYIQNEESSKLMIGIIPKMDYGKVDNVIGTVGIVQSVILIGPDPEMFYLIVQGLCRFKLDETVTERPIRINKITTINNFTEIIGDEKEKEDLGAEFQKVLDAMLIYSEISILNPFIHENSKSIFKKISISEIIEFCLKKMVKLTIVDAYGVLRASNLNNLLKLTMDLLRRETIKNKNSKFQEVGLVAIPSVLKNNSSKCNNVNKNSPELMKIQKTIQNAKLSTIVHDSIMKEFNTIKEMNKTHSDYSLLTSYISYVVGLPWNKITTETHDLKKAEEILQMNYFVMDKVKKRILQFIAVRILNPERKGPILCFIGPPGVGKTTIAKSIADSLNRIFIRISLGGTNHYSDIKGHCRTYIGAMPGCIIESIYQAQTKNPLILLDEIDKMYKGLTGDPAAALLEVLDPEQNSSFVDSYVRLPFDLSQVMFVTTANNPSGIPQALRDRMEIIKMDGYTLDEKMKIATNYLVPKILKDHKMEQFNIIIYEETIRDIILKYTCEAGVRELQRKLETIYQYIAVKIVKDADPELMSFIIHPDNLLRILGSEIYQTRNTLVEKTSNRVGVAIGLVWTAVGGEVQVIEASRTNSTNNFKLTGLAGQSLRESLEIAINWILSFAKKNEYEIKNYGAHIHFPEGGIKKDGSSAGITIVCSLVSLFWDVPLKPMIAMTGELSLKGFVLRVGGIKQKILAAYDSGIRTIIIPELNLKDLTNLPENITNELNIIPVKHVEDVLDIVTPGGLTHLQNASSNTMPKSKI